MISRFSLVPRQKITSNKHENSSITPITGVVSYNSSLSQLSFPVHTRSNSFKPSLGARNFSAWEPLKRKTRYITLRANSFAISRKLAYSRLIINILSGNIFFNKNKKDITNARIANHSLEVAFLRGNYSLWIRDGEYILIPNYHSSWVKLEQLGIYLLLNYFKLVAMERGEVLIYQCTLSDTYDG